MSYGSPQRRPVYIAGNSAAGTPRKQSAHSTPSGSVQRPQQASSSRDARPAARSARTSLDNTSAYQRFDEVSWLVDLSSRIEDALQTPVTIPGLRTSSGQLASVSSTPRSRVRLPQPSREFRDLRYSLQQSRRDPDASLQSVDQGSETEEVLSVTRTPASEWVKQAQTDFDRRRLELEQSRQLHQSAEEQEESSPAVDPAVERSLLAARSLQELMTSGGMEAEDGESPPHFAELLENAEAFPAATETGPSALFEAHRDSQGALDIERVLQHRAELARQSASQSNKDRASMLDLAPSQPQKPIIEMISAEDDQPQPSARPDGEDLASPSAARADDAFRAVSNEGSADQDDLSEVDEENAAQHDRRDPFEEGDEEFDDEEDEVDEEESDNDDQLSEEGADTRDLLFDGPVGDEDEPIVLSDSDEEEEQLDDEEEPLDDEEQPLDDEEAAHGESDEEEAQVQHEEPESDANRSPSASYPSDSGAEDDEPAYPQGTEAMRQLIIKALGEDSQLSQAMSDTQANEAVDSQVDLDEDAMPEDEVEEDEYDEDLRWPVLQQDHDEDAPLSYPDLPYSTPAATSGFVSASQLYSAQDLAAQAPLLAPDTYVEPKTTLAPIDPELLEATMVDYNAAGEDPVEAAATDSPAIDRISAEDDSIARDVDTPPADDVEDPQQALHTASDSYAAEEKPLAGDTSMGEVDDEQDHAKEQAPAVINGQPEADAAEPSNPAGPKVHEEPLEPVTASIEVPATLPEVLEDPLKLAELRAVTQHSAASSVSVAGSDENKVALVEPLALDNPESQSVDARTEESSLVAEHHDAEQHEREQHDTEQHDAEDANIGSLLSSADSSALGPETDKAMEEAPVDAEQYGAEDGTLSSALLSADSSVLEALADPQETDEATEEPQIRTEQYDAEDPNLSSSLSSVGSSVAEVAPSIQAEVVLPVNDVLEADVEDNNENDTEREDFGDEEIVRVRSASRSNDQKFEPFQIAEDEQMPPAEDHAPQADEAAVPDDESVESGDLADLDRPSERRPISPSETLLVKPGQELADAAAKTLSATHATLKRKVDEQEPDTNKGEEDLVDEAKPSDNKRVKTDSNTDQTGDATSVSSEPAGPKPLPAEEARKPLVPPSPASSDRRSTSSFTPSANRHGHRHIHGAQRNLFSHLGHAVSGVASSLVSPIKALQPMFPIEEASETAEAVEKDTSQDTSPRISEDAKFTITTRSHCLYRQLQLSNLRGSPVFMVPGCSINHEVAQREGAIDIGEATEQTSANWVDIDPDLLPHNVHHVLSRILGLQILREGIFAEPDSAAASLLDEQEPSIKPELSSPRLAPTIDGEADASQQDAQSVHTADQDEADDAAAESIALATRSRRSVSAMSTGSQYRTPRKSNPRSAQADYLPDEDREQLYHKRHDSAPDAGDFSIASLEGEEAQNESANESGNESAQEEVEPIRTRASTRKKRRPEPEQDLPKSENATKSGATSQADTSSRKRRSKRGGAAHTSDPSMDTPAHEEQREQASDDSKPLAEVPDIEETKPESAVDEDEVLDELGGEDTAPEPVSQAPRRKSGEKSGVTEVVILHPEPGPNSPRKSAAASKKRPRRSGRDASPKQEAPKTPPRKSARNKKLKL